MWLADIAQLVYLREGYVRAQFKRWGYEPVRWIENAATDTQAVVAVRNDHVVISFRGTEGRTDFLTDLLFPKLPFRIDSAGSRPLGKAHRGFVDALDSVWGQLLVALQGVGPDRPLFVSGHSLGAALAQLTAMRLESLGHAVAAVYVYGSPRVGDAQFRDAYNGVLKGRTFLHVNDRDIVTTVPPRWTGFAHVAQPARRFDEGHLITADDTESTSPASVPRGQDTQVANRDLMERAATVVRASHRYLGIDDLSAGAARSMTYGAQFDEGRLDDHGIAQYLFKFACAIVDDRIAAMT